MIGCVGGFPQAYDQFRGHIERWLFPEFMDFLYFVKTFFLLCRDNDNGAGGFFSLFFPFLFIWIFYERMRQADSKARRCI